jgi:hypothetical protein
MGTKARTMGYRAGRGRRGTARAGPEAQTLSDVPRRSLGDWPGMQARGVIRHGFPMARVLRWALAVGRGAPRLSQQGLIPAPPARTRRRHPDPRRLRRRRLPPVPHATASVKTHRGAEPGAFAPLFGSLRRCRRAPQARHRPKLTELRVAPRRSMPAQPAWPGRCAGRGGPSAWRARHPPHSSSAQPRPATVFRQRRLPASGPPGPLAFRVGPGSRGGPAELLLYGKGSVCSAEEHTEPCPQRQPIN